MMLAAINNKKLSLKIFCWLKSAKFQNNSKNDTPSGGWALSGGTILLSEILILVSFISYLSMIKKAKWFFEGKIWFFFFFRKILKSWNFAVKDIFSFLQAITFDTFKLAYWKFLHMFCTGNTTGKQRIKPSWVNSKASSFNTKLGKNENYFILEHFLLISPYINFG